MQYSLRELVWFMLIAGLSCATAYEAWEIWTTPTGSLQPIRRHEGAVPERYIGQSDTLQITP